MVIAWLNFMHPLIRSGGQKYVDTRTSHSYVLG
uniref:Uncharacterized protein n=1 Tax=Anguilla anguilla TaxID=7936 RepID=A0A0E9RH97_ANGAN